MGSATSSLTTTRDRTCDRRLFWLCIIAPLVTVVLVASGFLLGPRVLPEYWVVHVDGHGSVTYGAWWPLFAGAMLFAGLAFIIGWYFARDFTNLGHWYPQQKSIVIGCFAFGYAVLGLFVGNILAAVSSGDEVTAEAGMGYGLLSFVLVAIVATPLYTGLLPKAQQIH